MCGIAGILAPQPADPDALTSVVKGMADTLIHRGPDGDGMWSDGLAAFGHRRLAIIDLVDGDQPMRSERGTVITYNGEVYNYLEIRKELEDAGIRFRTRSDTEVVLRAFEHWGEDCVARFNGMFALAIWDPSRRKLFIARDRLGKKPFHYTFGTDGFVFASEIGALRTLPSVRAAGAIDAEALVDYLALGYVLTPKTIHRNIRTLPPATHAWIAPGDTALTPRGYWALEDHVRDTRISYDARARDDFANILEDAVRLRLRADVPVGLYLSGGLDSAAIASEAVRAGGGRVAAFTVSFDEASFDESADARRTARAVGMPITVIPSGAPHPSTIPALVRHAGQPFADTSSAPTYLLNKAAARHTKVALGGDGGDEILAGYPTYRADQLQRIYQYAPRALGRGLERLVTLAMRPSYRKLSIYYKLRQFLRAAGLSREEAHYWWRVIFDAGERDVLLAPALRTAAGGYRAAHRYRELFGLVEGGDASFLARAQYVDIKTWLADDILVKADRFSMAHSVEVRSPFLDHRLVEFCLRLEDRAKITATRQKVILRDVMAKHLPAEVLARRKQGFGAPTRQLGVLAPSPASIQALNPNYHLNPAHDDITYKSFSLAILNGWFDAGNATAF